MTARVLVVDDILANVRLLEARLSAEYFEVLTANSGRSALDIISRERVDVVVLDVMMPGMDGFEVCRRIKHNAKHAHVPVIMVTALDQPSDKVEGLEAGADDFLTKPVDDIALVTRVRSLARLKLLADELMMRASTSEDLGFGPGGIAKWADALAHGNILLVEDHARSARRIADGLLATHSVVVEPDPRLALLRMTEQCFDLAIVSLSLANADGLRLCSQVRSLDRTRHLPIVMMVDPGDEARLLRGLDMGVNDYVLRPIDQNELLARIKTQIKRKRHADLLRARLEQGMEHAITDPLTGLHNRRYMESHLGSLVDQAAQSGCALSVLVADIDYFKSVNDTYGHDVGDNVLREFATRIRRNTRGIDLTCRLGGEEFVIIMPGTDLLHAMQVAERLRTCIATEPFRVNASDKLTVTASVGVAALENDEDTPETLFKRADVALYSAKRNGRNRVVADAA